MVELNPEQLAAVHHPLDEPAVLVAGAGSGKTAVLTGRVRFLLNQDEVLPHRILALTFTNKAAGEMSRRLEIDEHSPRNTTPRVSTIHSLALSAIRRSPTGFGLLHKVTPLDDYDQESMLKKIVEREQLTVNAWALLEKIGFHRARGIGFSPEYTEEYARKAKEIHGGFHVLDGPEKHLWELYEEEKKKSSVVDFDDMLHLCVRRGRTDKSWRELMENNFDYVLMDEAQDTNPVQWEFVNMLVRPGNQNFYVVGDVSQSIYGFNGAVPGLLVEYSQQWRGATPKMYRIARNHRSVPEIVALANTVQATMTETIPLRMESWRGLNGQHGRVADIQAYDPSGLATMIAQEIRRDREVIPYRENAILIRVGMQVRDIESELVRFRIPYIVRGGRGLLQTEEVRDMLAYLRLAVNPNDITAFARAVAVPRRGVGNVAIEKIRKRAEEQFDGDVLKAAVDYMPDKLFNFSNMMKTLHESADDPITCLTEIIEHTGYKTYIKEKYKSDPERINIKFENLGRFMNLIKGLLEDKNMTTEDLVFQLTVDKTAEDDPEGKVVISTIHAAKGLEWKRVFVFNVVEGLLPHKYSVGSDSEVEEERRLWYVAITRAKDILKIGICEHVSMRTKDGERLQAVQPSRFLKEAGWNV